MLVTVAGTHHLRLLGVTFEPASAIRGALRPAPSEDQATSRPAAQANRAIVGSEGATAADRRQRLRTWRA